MKHEPWPALIRSGPARRRNRVTEPPERESPVELVLAGALLMEMRDRHHMTAKGRPAG
jgi:hypothetical protein